MIANQKQIQKDFLEELGLAELSEEKKGELLSKMSEVLLKRIFLATMEKLDGKGRIEYEKMISEKAEAEDIESFFKSKIENYEAMVENIIVDFKREMINDLKT